MADDQGFIPAHGGYEDLLSYQKTVIVYDATVAFCARFLSRRDRTYDQMVQAARSGKQNIVEGSMASAVSKKTELKLTNVARASLEELLEDYRDFLRSRGAPVWEKNSREAVYVRRLSRLATPGRSKHETHGTDGTHEAPSARAPEAHATRVPGILPGSPEGPGTRAGASPASPEAPAARVAHTSHRSHGSHKSHSPCDSFRPLIETRPPEVAANIIICLIHQANYLLDRQLRQLEQDFVEHGGLSEAMTRARLSRRDTQYRQRP